MKRTLAIFSLIVFILSCGTVLAQTDSSYQGSSALPPTSKSKQSEAATRYSAPPPPANQKSDWRKRIYVGGYFGLSFSNVYSNVEISPIVGYRITDNFSMGVGVIYRYYSYEYFNLAQGNTQKASFSNWGGRINANYRLFDLIALGAEYQYITNDWLEGYDDLGNPVWDKKGVNILFVGGGLSKRVGGNAIMYVMAYYDILQEQYSPYSDNIIWRIGVSAGF